MPAERPLRVSPDVVAQDLGDGLVLLNLRTGIYWGLNRTGAVVWRGIERSASVERIRRELRSEFEGAGEDLDDAVRNLLSELLVERLIVEADPRSRDASGAGEGRGRRAPQPDKTAAARSAGTKGARNKMGGRKTSPKLAR